MQILTAILKNYFPKFPPTGWVRIMKAYFLMYAFCPLYSFFRALKIYMRPRKGASLLNFLVFKQALFTEKQKMVDTLVNRSFLDEASKRGYLLHYNTRRNFLIAS